RGVLPCAAARHPRRQGRTELHAAILTRRGPSTPFGAPSEGRPAGVNTGFDMPLLVKQESAIGTNPKSGNVRFRAALGVERTSVKPVKIDAVDPHRTSRP